MRRTASLVLILAALVLAACGGPAASPTAVAQNPTTALATAEPTQEATSESDGGLAIDPVNVTPTPTLPVASTPIPDASFNGTPVGPNPTLKPPKSLDDLKKEYPELGPFIEKYKDSKVGDLDMTQLYARVVEIYDKEGATGVATFLEGSGLLEKLGIPLSYLDLLRAYEKGGLTEVGKLARIRQIVNDKDEIVAYLALDSKDNQGAVTASMTELGVTLYAYNDQKEELEIGIPLAVLAQFQTPGKLLEYLVKVANVQHVVGYRVPTPIITSGLRMQQVRGIGAQTMGADKWHAAGFTGKGIRIGVIDMGFGGIRRQLGRTLPANVKTNIDINTLDRQQENHGLACAMVIHSVAPDAELFLAYMDGSSYDTFLQSLEFMRQNKVQIINYSVGSAIGPRDGTFGDSLVIDEFVRDTGVLWVNAAGNYALSHTVFEFKEGQDGFHTFGQDDSGQDVYFMPFIAGEPITSIAMNWNGNWQGGEKTQYNYTVFDRAGNEIVVANEPRRGRANDLPYQLNGFQANPGEMYLLAIQRSRGSTDNIIDIFIPNGVLVPWAQVPGYSVTVPADSDSALSVGATGLTKDQIEEYSSQGPTTDGRVKPDLSAPTGEPVPGYEDQGFIGTSGAAPMVAGAAGLVLQASPELSAAELKAFLVANVTDLGDVGPDNVFGAGRLQLPDSPEGGGGGEEGVIEIGGSKSGAEASAAVTNVSTKFNVRAGGEVGLQIKASFELDNYKGKQLILAVLFFDANDNSVPSANPEYEVNGTIGTGTTIKPKSNQTVYKDVTLFVANSAFEDVKAAELYFIVALFDADDQSNAALLAKSDPVKVKIRKR